MFLEELEKYLRKIIPHIEDTEEIQESIRVDLEESLYQALVVSYLLGWDHIAREEKIEAAENNHFYIYPEGAVKKLIKRVSMSRDQFYELDAKARFKAFTVSWVTSMDAVKKVKSVIASNMIGGESIRGFVERVGADEIISQSGFSLTKPWYWEVVYRTNVIAAYNAGRFEGAKAYKNRIQYLTFIAILDERTTDICRSYDGITRPVDDPIWQSITPPNHFQCRSTVRAVWKYEKDKPKLTSKKDLVDLPMPQEGFDASPVDWWKIPKEMMKRAKKQGIAGEIEKKQKETEKIIEEKPINVKSDIPKFKGNFAVTMAEGQNSKNDVLFHDKIVRPEIAKKQITEDLARRLAGNDDFKELVEYLKNDVNFTEYKNIWSCKSDEETAAAYLIHNWAMTSADNNPISLAIQISADKEFNTGASLNHLLWRESFASAKELFERHEKGFKAFLRAQYDSTQELFKKLGIKKVRLYRGMKLSDKELKLSKEIIEKLDRPDPDVSFAIAEKKKISLQPISSFSLDPDQAMNFTFAGENHYRILIACDMPVERILSTARTGYGCLEEAECVVIGIQEEEFAMGITKKGVSNSMLRALIDEYK